MTNQQILGILLLIPVALLFIRAGFLKYKESRNHARG